MDVIIIQDLEVSYRVGVLNEERAQPQRLLITLELRHNLQPAALSDALELTVDYAAVCQAVLQFGERREWKLLEKLAEDLWVELRQQFAIRGVTLTIKKFVIPQAQWVGVRVVRGD